MTHSKFNIIVHGSPEAFLGQARGMIENASGSFSYNGTQGNFHVPTPFGRIKGTTRLSGQTVTVAITSKPLLLSWEDIRREMETLMGQAGVVAR